MTEPSEARVRAILEEARSVAVLGAHNRPYKPAHYVPAYLAEQGYRVIPVNPAFIGESLFGERVRARLQEIGEPIDIVDVFRRGEAVPDHVDDILAMQPRPRVVWLQLGIRNDEVAERLRSEGIEVVQDRCTLADHRRFGIAPVPGIGRDVSRP